MEISDTRRQPERHTRAADRLGEVAGYAELQAVVRSSPHRTEALTPRELRVLALVAAGRTNAAIADELSCSPRTVAKHLEHVYSKLQVSNRAAAAAQLATELALQRHPLG